MSILIRLISGGLPDLTLTLATTDEDDALSCSIAVIGSISLATTDTDDTVSCTLTSVVSAALATTDEDDTVSVSLDADISATLATTDEDDIVSCSLEQEQKQVTVPLPTGRSKKKRGGKQLEYISPVVPELLKQEPEEISEPKLEKKDIVQHEKIISEAWKEKYQEQKEFSGNIADSLEEILGKNITPKQTFDFDAMERELTQAVRKKQIQQQNELIMMLAVEEE